MSQNFFSVVTTFNKESYESYCNKMLLSFDNYWPKEINIHVYYEDMEKPSEDRKSTRLNSSHVKRSRMQSSA